MNFKKVLMFILSVLLCSVSGAYADNESHFGTVVETMNAGNYTYIKLDEEGNEVWLAARPIKVSAGEEIEYAGGVPMKDFQSKSLGRKFESIIFITKIRVLNRAPENESAETAPADNHNYSPKKSKTASLPGKGEIQRAKNGKTVHEVFTEREQLKDKEVILRAKVIKVSTNILGKNWVTLSDGTGTAPENKITATTSEVVNPGDILTVRGTVKNNVNIGAGYKYKVMIGDAGFTK